MRVETPGCVSVLLAAAGAGGNRVFRLIGRAKADNLGAARTRGRTGHATRWALRRKGAGGTMTRHAVFLGIYVALGWLCAPAAGQVPMLLHRQPPGRTFGYASDTQFRDDFGRILSALYADRFELAAGGEVCRVVAWAFFGGSYEPFDPPPPASETLRVRFYDEAAGLPGSELLSQTFDNPPRIFTGFTVSGDPRRREYRYEFHLSPCLAAAPGTAYWVEISQISDPDSIFRWEGSNTPGQYAVQFPIGAPWQVVTGSGQIAYELWTPEPTSLFLAGAGVLGAVLRRRRGRR
jgi:hypothetical protein